MIEGHTLQSFSSALEMLVEDSTAMAERWAVSAAAVQSSSPHGVSFASGHTTSSCLSMDLIHAFDVDDSKHWRNTLHPVLMTGDMKERMASEVPVPAPISLVIKAKPGAVAARRKIKAAQASVGQVRGWRLKG